MYLCICNDVKSGDVDKYHLIGNDCGRCKRGTYPIVVEKNEPAVSWVELVYLPVIWYS